MNQIDNLNIVYIANARFPNERAHGIQFAKTCASLIKEGADLELVLPNRKTKIKEDPFEYYCIKDKFLYKKIWTINILPKTAFGFLLSSFVFGITSFLYVLKKKNSIIYSIDLDHISFFLLPFLKRSYFFEMHGPKKNTFLNRFLFKKMKGVIAINNAIKNDLIEKFPYLNDKIIVCPNGVDLDEDKSVDKNMARKKLSLPMDKKIVVYTGSFQDWKGIETIIESAKKLEDTLFYFVGGSKKEDLPENVRFVGWRDFKEMPLWRAAADILIATGTKKNEYSYLHTSPMKLFEYMASKRPIVASRTPAIGQIVSNREIFFHEPDNAQDLADKIRFVFENKKEADKRAESAYIKAGEYSWNTRAKKIINFIKDKS